VVCGRGRKEGVEICADHIKPKDKGGDNSVDNGQTLCMEHNLIKKNYSQTEAGKRYFIKIYNQAVDNGDEKIVKFCKDIFDIFNKHGINGHIKRPNGKYEVILFLVEKVAPLWNNPQNQKKKQNGVAWGHGVAWGRTLTLDIQTYKINSNYISHK